MDFLNSHEFTIRFGIFVIVLAIMSILEYQFPKKQRNVPRAQRWFTNYAITLIDSLVLRFLVPVAAMGVAAIVSANSWGLLNIIELPMVLEIVIAVMFLDMCIYWQHVASHRFAILWRIHKVHHADRDIDASTGVRFHPVEIVLSMLYKMAIVFFLGPAVLAVFIFEILLNASALFNHANVSLPKWLDRIIRWVFVTPDMHRIHHSVVGSETNSNYGFNLACWDRLFGSYVESPIMGHTEMTIGLPEYQDERPTKLLWVLQVPFLKSSINRSAIEKSR